MSNKLVNSNLILYDRDTETWWPQMLGVGIANDLRGYALVETEVVWTTWERWRRKYPDTKVLSEDTGVIRDYGDDPYGSYGPDPRGYYASPDHVRTVMHEDDTLHAKEVVTGVRTSDGAIAFVKETMRQLKVATEGVGDALHSAFYDDRLDVVYVYRNPDSVSFSYENGQYLAPDNGSYRADEIPLESVDSFDAMWFAWFAYFPETALGATEYTPF